MIYLIQTKLCTETQAGNCLATALACILELPLVTIPKFEIMGSDWFSKFSNWLESIGFYPIILREKLVFPGYYLVMGVSPRDKNVNQQVIFKNGKMIHDPHPSGDGILNIKEIMLLVPFDPSNLLCLES